MLCSSHPPNSYLTQILMNQCNNVIEKDLTLRNGRPELFCKKAALKTFPKFTEKRPALESLFNKVEGLSHATLSKRNSSAGVFL